MPGPVADRALLTALESARDDKLRAGLVDSLGNRESASAVPAVAKWIASSYPSLVDAVLNALGSIGNVPRRRRCLRSSHLLNREIAWADASLRAAEALQPSAREKSLALYRAVQARRRPTGRRGPPRNRAALRRNRSPRSCPRCVPRTSHRDRRARSDSLRRIGPTAHRRCRRNVSVAPCHSADSGSLGLAGSRRPHRGTDRAPVPHRGQPRCPRRGCETSFRHRRGLGCARTVAGNGRPGRARRLGAPRAHADSRPETSPAVLESFRAGGEARAAALEVLVGRGHRALLAELLRPENFADETFGPLAANAVLMLGTGADLAACSSFIVVSRSPTVAVGTRVPASRGETSRARRSRGDRVCCRGETARRRGRFALRGAGRNRRRCCPQVAFEPAEIRVGRDAPRGLARARQLARCASWHYSSHRREERFRIRPFVRLPYSRRRPSFRRARWAELRRRNRNF